MVDNGLSAGGQGTWEMYTTFPTYITGLIPMSAVYSAYTDPAFVNKVKYHAYLEPAWRAGRGACSVYRGAGVDGYAGRRRQLYRQRLYDAGS